jgi:hypothetical protein
MREFLNREAGDGFAFLSLAAFLFALGVML